MRYQYLLLVFCLLSINVFAQSDETDITGLWKGTLYNDTTQLTYKYELGISEQKGKLGGFSHTWVILDDKQYYGIKKLKIKREGNKLIVEETELIANNYPVAPVKGIRNLAILILDTKDSIMKMAGEFSTNTTKKYLPATGTIRLEKNNDYWQSALVPHLQELSLANNLSFLQDDKLLAQNNIIIEAKQSTGITTKNKIIENKGKAIDIKNISTPVVAEEAIVKAQPIKSEDPKNIDTKNGIDDIAKLNIHKSDTVYSIASASGAPQVKEIPAKQKEQPIENSNAKPVVQPTENSIVKTTPTPTVTAQVPVVAANKINEKIAEPKTTPVAKIAAADVEKRTTLLQQTVSFRSDSLQISLYDNGEVDGDTVSVLMNGNVIMAKERLSTNAIRKTIYIPQETDSVQLVMYAENLGLIPPNTGLLVVKDGKDLYEIRFSGDLQKNAAILLRRKKKDQ
jgi:hypothetical protein